MARVLPQPPLTVIAGPTGAGKTDLAIALAERLGAEIVSADSQAVYRHFDLGTAKPEPEQLARVPHHGISVVEPTEAFSAARWVELADAAIADIAARGRPIVVVGGTGLYVRALLHGLTDTPPDPEARRALEIHATTGTAPSKLRAAHAFRPARYPARIHFLDPPREELERRIAARTRRMFERGLLAEVSRLVSDGFRDTAPMRSVGYRQALAVL